MEQELGQAPDKLVIDAGYGNQDTLRSCQQRGVTPVCATAREGVEGPESGKLDRFSYDWDHDQFACPHGHAFGLDHEHPTSGTRTYKTPQPVPCTCGHYETANGREVISVGQSHLAKRELQRILDEPGHRELYRRRKCTAEPSFGQIKAGMGFRRFLYRRFLYRGGQNVRSECNLMCAAFNVKKMAVLLRARRRPANPELAPRDEAANSPLFNFPLPIFLFFSSFLARWTRLANPRPCADTPLAQAA
jgi:hypothetical protein